MLESSTSTNRATTSDSTYDASHQRTTYYVVGGVVYFKLEDAIEALEAERDA